MTSLSAVSRVAPRAATVPDAGRRQHHVRTAALLQSTGPGTLSRLQVTISLLFMHLLFGPRGLH